MATDPGMLTDWYKSYMGSQPKTAAASTTTAGTTDWTPDKNSTVQGQVANITDAGGPLMDRAATKAQESMNGRGLLNTSLAVSAGQSALYDAAMPMATQDANTYAQAGQFNANAKNSASQFNANAANATSQFNAAADNTATGQQSAAGIQGEQTAQQRAENAAGREFTTSERLGTQGFQAGESALGRQQQTMLQSTDIANQQAMQKAGFTQQTAVQSADIANQQGMQQAGFQQQSALQSQDFAQQTKTQQADLASRYDLANMDVQSRAALQKADAANQQQLQAANATLQTNLATQSQAVQQSMQRYQLSVQQAMNGQDNETKLQLQSLDASTQTALAKINNDNRIQLQTSQSMANTFSQLTTSVAQIMADPNLDPDAKQRNIDNLTNMYSASMGMQSKLTGLNLGTLLAPDTTVGKQTSDTPAADTKNTIQPWNSSDGGGP